MSVTQSSGGAAFSQINVSGTSYTDNNVLPGTTYLYKVKAVVGSATTNFSNTDLATTTTFTDANSLQGISILATHLLEIRNAANMVLVAANLPTVSWPSLTSGVTVIQASDIAAVRTALVNAYYSIGLPIPNFSEPITAGTTIVKATHFQELRNLVN